MDVRRLITNHKESRHKSTKQLIMDKQQEIIQQHNNLRKQWLPERYDDSLDHK